MTFTQSLYYCIHFSLVLLFIPPPPPTERSSTTIRKGMRLCTHVRLLIRYRQTPMQERGLMEHISRLKICYRDIAYTIKRKHKCSVLLRELWRNSISKDSFAMLFLLTAFALESNCKDTNKNQNGKNYSFFHALGGEKRSRLDGILHFCKPLIIRTFSLSTPTQVLLW